MEGNESSSYVVRDIPDDLLAEAAKLVFDAWPDDCRAAGCGSSEEYARMLEIKGVTLVATAAKEEDGLAGICSILDDDLPERRWLGPWLANLVVVPEHRGRGLGRQLVAAALAKAISIYPDLATLYLWTDRALISYYRDMGWSPVEILKHHGKAICVMKYRLKK